MKISVNDKLKCFDTLKGVHSKTFKLISSEYSVEFLYKILKNNQKIINKKDENNETLLSYAIKRKNIKVIDLLLTSPMLDYSYQTLQGNSYLHLAVIYELESVIKKLIEKDIDINMKNMDGNTALHYAYSVNNYKIIILLLQNKIDFTIKNNQGLIAEEIEPYSLKKDDLIKNNNNQINKSIIIDWETNKFDNNDIDNENINKNNIKTIQNIYKAKNSTPLIIKKTKNIYNYNYTNKFDKNNKEGIYRKIKAKCINYSPCINQKGQRYNITNYNNTEKHKVNFINNLLDSKRETLRKNIFENKILPSNHKVNWHICDLNYLSNHKNNKMRTYRKISKSQYFIKGIKNKNNFSPIKLKDRYDSNDDTKIFSDRNYINSKRLLTEDNNLLFFDEIKAIDENITNKNNNNDSINQKSTNESFSQNNLSLFQFLSKIKMEKYFNNLQNNGFDDVNLLISQTRSENPITDFHLKEIGIKNMGDRARILIRLEEIANNFGYSLPNEVYYICENINDININDDININKLFQWLTKINVGEYLDNFLINGYYNIELLLIQMISKNPLNDDILKNDLEINKIGHRTRILNRLIEDSKDFNKKLKNKIFVFTNRKEDKSCDCAIY